VQRILLLVLACIYSLVCLSQDERQHAFAHYGTDKGLAGYDVRAVVQDDAGYMWVGTSTGLQRFDGTRFITFYNRNNDSTSIPENSINQLFRCKKNKLWLLTGSGQVGVFDTKNFRYKAAAIQPAKKSSILADKKFFTDSHGNIYLLCFKSELLVYNEKENRFISAANLMPLPPKWSIISFCEEVKTGKYYIGTDSGMVVYNPQTHKQSYAGHNVENELLIEQYGRIPFVAPMLLDSKQRLWFLTWPPDIGGPYFFCFNLQSKKTVLKQYSFFPLIKAYYEPNAMIEQKNGTVWIKGGNIFARYLDKENKFQLVHNGYTNNQSIAFEMVCDLREDREENLWVATNNNGLFRFNPSQEFFFNVHHYNRAKNTPGEGSPLSFIEDNGTILMSAWGNGIYRYDSSFNSIPVGIKGIIEKNSVVVWHMLAGNDGRTIWMGTQPGGLYKYDCKTRSAQYYEVPAVEGSTICQLAEDKSGNLWLGTYSQGLYKYSKTGSQYDFTRHVEKINAVDARMINALSYDKNGHLMVATNTNGVYVIDTSNNRVLHHFSTDGPANQQLPGIKATAICNYNDTTIFIGCGGINIYNPVKQTIQPVRMGNSRPNDVAAIQKDRNGYIWITQSTGLLRFSLSKKNIVIVFDRIDGINNDHFIPGAAASLADGRLLFGSSNQFIVFDPQHIDLVDSLPDVSITGFKVQDKSLQVDSLRNLKLIELEPTENNITIELSSLMYNSTSIIKYKLEGIDKDWIRTDISNQAVYPYLPQGTYTFNAITEDSEGTPGKSTTTLIIKVKPIYWETWWFFGMILFLCLGIFLWFDKLRMLKIKATESVRNRIAHSLTEDMGNSLSSINITSELAKTKIDTDTERTKEYIIQISDSSNRMVQAMYDMVWSINPENDTLQHTVDRMKSYAAEMESMYTPSIIFQIDEQAKDVRLSMETRYEMLSIYKEAVNNAARHAQAKYIEVNLRYKKPALILCVRDDGKGFDVELVELSRGLSEMRRRAATINAKLTLKSEINTGTSVRLVMSK